MKTITNAQIARIHIWKSRLGLSDADYRAVLSGFGVESSKDLPDGKFREVQIAFERLLHEAGMVSEAQLKRIRDLAKDHVTNLPGFCSKIARREIRDPGALARSEARKVIEALKRYHRPTKEHGSAGSP
jgi:hypothetical protein